MNLIIFSPKKAKAVDPVGNAMGPTWQVSTLDEAITPRTLLGGLVVEGILSMEGARVERFPIRVKSASSPSVLHI